MTVVAVIPARGGSKGIPRKNLRLIGGVPLVGRSVRTALAAESIDRVYVSTEDDEIAKVADEYGATVIPRPCELATDEAYTLPVLKHAIEWITDKDELPDILVEPQCGSPLTTAADIDGAVAMCLADPAIDVVVSVCADHSYQCRPRRQNGPWFGVEWITLDPTVIDLRRQELPPTYRLNGSIFVFRPSSLMTAEHSLFGRIQLYEMPVERSVDIDSPLDLHLAEAMYRYQDQWIVIGSSPSVRKGLAAARARYPAARTITTNRGCELFGPHERPDVYHIHDMLACDVHQQHARDFAAKGSLLTTLARKSQRSLKSRGVDWFDEFLELTSHDHPGRFKPGAYASCGLSGLMIFQYVLNHGAQGVHLVGMEGYGDSGHYFNGDPDMGPEKNHRFTRTLIEPFVQSCIDACPEVQFTFYGNLNYSVSGENVRCVN